MLIVMTQRVRRGGGENSGDFIWSAITLIVSLGRWQRERRAVQSDVYRRWRQSFKVVSTFQPRPLQSRISQPASLRPHRHTLHPHYRNTLPLILLASPLPRIYNE